MAMTRVTRSLEETYELAKEFLAKFSIFNSQFSKKALVVGLYGDLGSGKTTFVQGLARALGIKENITSPTFVIEKIYKLPKPYLILDTSYFIHLIHIDAYRLESGEELEKLGWPELVADPANLIVIEWADRVGKILPSGAIKINFKFIDESTRQISW